MTPSKINLRRLLFIVLALLMPSALRAHTHLASSSPAKGDTVHSPVSEIHLKFTEAADANFTTVVLLDATGQEVGLGKLHAIGQSPSKEFILTLERPLVAGAYTVKWKAAAADGHASTGMFDFVVDVPGSVLPVPGQPVVSNPATPMVGMHQHHSAAEVEPIFKPDTSPLWIATRFLNFLALMLLVGAVAFRFGVVNRTRFNDDQFVIGVDDAARRFAIFVAWLALLTSALRLWLQCGAMVGTDRMWHWDAIRQIIFKTGWGKAWLAQTLAAFGFLVAAAIKTEDRNESWYSAAAFAVIAAATPAFSGHAAAVQQMAIVPVLDDVAHVISASAWLGTLLFILVCGVPVAVRSGRGGERIATFIHTFSPFAMTMGLIAMFTGAMNAFVQIASFGDLLHTHYGRILLIKIGLVIITATMGAYNWKVVRPRLGDEQTGEHFKKSATAELVVAAVIIAVTAILVGTPTG